MFSLRGRQAIAARAGGVGVGPGGRRGADGLAYQALVGRAGRRERAGGRLGWAGIQGAPRSSREEDTFLTGGGESSILGLVASVRARDTWLGALLVATVGHLVGGRTPTSIDDATWVRR